MIMLKVLANAIRCPKILLAVTVVTCGVASGYWFYNYAYDKGYAACNREFTSYKAEQLAQIQKLESAYHEQEKKYQKETESLVVRITQAKETYSKQLLVIEHSYADKLLKSEQRASLYKQMSGSSKCSCNSLADYSARLDRNLTEGINLVRELRELIKLRDEQLKQCGKQFQLIGKVNAK